jgi:hypothetical protein
LANGGKFYIVTLIGFAQNLLVVSVRFLIPKMGAALFTKGPFIYYVTTLLGFLDPLLPLT